MDNSILRELLPQGSGTYDRAALIEAVNQARSARLRRLRHAALCVPGFTYRHVNDLTRAYKAEMTTQGATYAWLGRLDTHLSNANLSDREQDYHYDRAMEATGLEFVSTRRVREITRSVLAGEKPERTLGLGWAALLCALLGFAVYWCIAMQDNNRQLDQAVQRVEAVSR